VIRGPLENGLRRQVKELYGDDFQAFVVELLLMVHSTEGFTPVRSRKDQGADGLLVRDNAVVACWGPEQKPFSRLKAEFEKKAAHDYACYVANWQGNYSRWTVYVNHDPAPEEIKFVDQLKQGSKVVGLTQIVHMVEQELTSTQRRRVCELLRIPAALVETDLVDGLLEDVLRASDQDAIIDYEKAPMYTPDKIRLNFTEAECDSIQEEFDSLELEHFGAIQTTLPSFNDRELAKIKQKIITDFNMESGPTVSNRLGQLTQRYMGKYASGAEEDYRPAIRALLFWVFEQCLIGRKVGAERDRRSEP
jgi:hypothetical protein